MRRFLALCVAVFMLMSATACGAKDNDYTPDFSGHTDPHEADFITELIDLSQLKDGGQHLVFHTEPGQLKQNDFAGWIKGEDSSYDVRSMDISIADLSKVENFNDISFDARTIWPEELPEGFDPEAILELNKNPGLNIRQLHEQGVTGKGVGIAIIDQGLYTEHEEYKDNLKSLEVIHSVDGKSAGMHGAAVASIAVGKTVGVAPEADLYYVDCSYVHPADNELGYELDASIIGEAILRVCDMNKYLPEENRIRVISISRGYERNDKGYEELQAAIKSADEQGIFVLTTSSNEYYKNFDIFGLYKNYVDDPDDINSYHPADWYGDGINTLRLQNAIFIPIGSRAYASWTGADNYQISYSGGHSWAIPWCAGLYALCCQVDPDITPSDFIELIKTTATDVPYRFVPTTEVHIKIVNPVAAIDELRK